MRLSKSEIDNLVRGLLECQQIASFPFSLFLFGSRTKDFLAGGDIDLLLVTKSSQDAAFLNNHRHYLVAALKTYIEDQRIDLTIRSSEQFEQLDNDAFIQSIKDDLVLLFSR